MSCGNARHACASNSQRSRSVRAAFPGRSEQASLVGPSGVPSRPTEDNSEMTRPTVMRAGSMRVVRIATLLIFSILLVDLAAQSTPAGRWRAVFVDPARGMATFNEVILVLKADGDALTGTAEMDPWPGLAAITNGKIDGDSFSFTWTATRPSSGGIPHVTFTGTVDGDRMKLTMISDGGTMEMRGERLPNR